MKSSNYSLIDIPPGRCQVSVEIAGFKKEVKDNIEVVLDSTARVNMQLSPGASVTQTVEVSASAPMLKTDRGQRHHHHCTGGRGGSANWHEPQFFRTC